MKVLITTDFYLPNITGVTTVILNQREVFQAMGHEVRVLTIGPKRRTFYQDGVYHIKACCLKLFPDSYMTCSFHDRIIEEIIAWKPDIVHSNNEFFSMAFAKHIAEHLSIPLIHTCHTDFTRYDASQRIRHSLWDNFIARVVRFRVRNSTCIISPSFKHRDMLLRYGMKNDIHVIPSGVDLKQYRERIDEQKREQIRKGFSFTSQNFVLVSVCRLAPEKHVSLTIDNFFLLQKLESRVRLLIVGGGPKQEKLEKQVQELHLQDTVRFSGPIASDQVHQYYQAGDLFVSSSIRESQGLSFVEALASGLPLLCRDDAFLGISVEDLACGCLYADSKEFVHKCSALIENEALYTKYCKNAHQASGQFCREAWGEKLLALFRSCLE